MNPQHSNDGPADDAQIDDDAIDAKVIENIASMDAVDLIDEIDNGSPALGLLHIRMVRAFMSTNRDQLPPHLAYYQEAMSDALVELLGLRVDALAALETAVSV